MKWYILLLIVAASIGAGILVDRYVLKKGETTGE